MPNPTAPRSRAQVYRRRRITVGVILALVVALLVYLPLTLLAPLSKASAQTISSPAAPQATAAPVFPGYGVGAIGAIGWDGVLAQSGDGQPHAMASITKIITALVVLEKHPLAADEDGPSVTMTAKDVGYYSRYQAMNGSVKPVRAGAIYTERQLLELTLIESAANYAQTTAVWAYGSEEAYLAAAKDWLVAHKLTSTTVADTIGLDPGSASTATDLVELGKIALTQPALAQIVDTKKMDIPGVGEVENTNYLLGHDGVDGIKTGTLDGYGANLLFSATWKIGGHPVRIVGVVVGAPDHRTLKGDLVNLLTTTRAGFHSVDVAAEGTAFATYQTVWGQKSQAVAAKKESLLVWSDTPIAVKVTAAETGVALKGAKLGTAVFSAGPNTVEVPLALSKKITDPGPWWRLSNPGSLG
ncbi:D-alanyl-D-alanine carboxypeptidase [Schumannella luteola]|uniref:D-alanyl-D-alanine carboxypeptidase (Penicillin-binding protein 5/6) n=1 Tax=Schumannella luteola TaxID=472059 RepID=A0A852YFM0_9MICO|nr:D-alanyl-D-alanine carboxypeptidase (penicillin-binding protein 5/6) [Schumannella luteola]TPX05504.1 D-alanyl-D-alanine carboxypeptidase [Schumannella luteola]